MQTFADPPPPSFPEYQFDVVLRRQRMRPPEGGGLKVTDLPSRFLNLPNHFEFAGWGSVTHLKLEPEERNTGEEILQGIQRERVMGQFVAGALAGNDILGGVFYTLPAVFAVSNAYSPISLFIAALTLFLWRPVMEELASALPISGAPYTYLLNVSSKNLALIGAVLLLLDFASTAVVSAATAASYIASEVSLPFPVFVCAILALVLLAAVSLCGVKESTHLAFAILLFHISTMVALVIASAVAWVRVGNNQLKENWSASQHSSSAGSIPLQVFNGFCFGMLGLTGFECAPALAARIKPGRFPLVLRNLHACIFVFNCSTALSVLVLIPLDRSSGVSNVLSILAEVASGRWLRIWIVVDAIVVLCAGILTGVLSASELFQKLAHDRVLPQVFLKTMPVTGSHYISILSFVGFSGVLYASAGGNLTVLSEMFSLVWLTVMTLFPVSLLLLKFNRGRLPRQPQTSLFVVFATLAVAVAVFAGTVAINLSTLGYFSAYVVGLLLVFSATQNKLHVLRWVYWTYDQNPVMHTWRLSKRWGEGLIGMMTTLKRQPVCVLAKTDEINHLFQMILYVRQNEETSCLKIVHFHDGDEGIPSEMEANAKILDEQFPEITIDLVRALFFFFQVSSCLLTITHNYSKNETYRHKKKTHTHTHNTDFGPWRIQTVERRCAFPTPASSSLAHLHELSWCSLFVFCGGIWDADCYVVNVNGKAYHTCPHCNVLGKVARGYHWQKDSRIKYKENLYQSTRLAHSRGTLKKRLFRTQVQVHSRMPLCSIIPLLILCTSILVQGSYYIDDADTTFVKADSSWGLFTPPKSLTFLLHNGTTSVDPSPCHGQTYTAGICTTDQECKLRILFTGSGITVYILQAGPYGVNMSARIDDDGGSPTVITLDAPSPPDYYQLNVPIFDIQSLPSADHVLYLDALSYDKSWSPILFDYAVVNEAFVPTPMRRRRRLFARASESTSATPWTSPTSIPLPSSSSHNHTNAAIIGGATAGAVVLLILTVAAFLYFRRRQQQPRVNAVDLGSELKTASSRAPNLLSETPYSLSPFVPDPGQAPPHHHQHSGSDIAAVQRSTQPNNTLVSDTTKTSLSSHPHPHPHPPPPPPPPPSSSSLPIPVPGVQNHQLTPEQVDFVYNLYTNNVPAPTLARVVETLANPGSSSHQDGSGRGLEAAPPEYSTLVNPTTTTTTTNPELSLEGSTGIRRRQPPVLGQGEANGKTLVAGDGADVLQQGHGG